jgi:hypothetical protein
MRLHQAADVRKKRRDRLDTGPLQKNPPHLRGIFLVFISFLAIKYLLLLNGDQKMHVLPENYSANRLVDSITAGALSAVFFDAAMTVASFGMNLPDLINSPVKLAIATGLIGLVTGAISYRNFDPKKNPTNNPSF